MFDLHKAACFCFIREQAGHIWEAERLQSGQCGRRNLGDSHDSSG